MAKDVQLPSLGENIESGQVVNVLVGVGDRVEANQTVLEIETDKASIDVPVGVAGTVVEIRAKAGSSIAVGDVFMTIDPGSVETHADDIGGSNSASKSEADAEPESPPVSAASNADIAVAPAAMTEPQSRVANVPVAVPQQRVSTKLVPAAPSTRRFAREIGIDITAVTGSGRSGRISIDDVKAYAKTENLGRIGSAMPDRDLPDFSHWGDIEIMPMSTVRKRTAAHVAQTWATVPQVTQFDEADITDLETQRKQYGEGVRQAGGKLTVTAILVKIVAAALHKFPHFNASVDPARSQIIHKRYYHIGVAVDTEHGLLVPVIRDADRKNITAISLELSTIAAKARDKKLLPDDMRGGTFTISNLGGIGGTGFTPIINWPEVAILGVARGGMQPVFDGTAAFEPRLVLPLSLSYDHRCIDGADGARFLRWIAAALENPMLVLLEG